ncbi:MAG: M23 family metallopeptidase [Rhodospirillaceae bacterium]|nr:M23 family metallopeptidase [Rhodospirillaceae bacterium]
MKNPCFQQFGGYLRGLVMISGLMAGPAWADAETRPKLSLPIACDMGKDCWLVNLVDLDSGPGRRDYRCGKQTYDGHKGVDIAVRDVAAMKSGVSVVASASGVVKGVRDGMPDRIPDDRFRRQFRHLYCGNGLVITHKGGWETQYCHLRRGSVAVKSGERVERGQKLGFVGHSGMAEFPHVHLSVRRAGKVVDPFLGDQAKLPAICAAGPGALWTKAAARKLAAPTTALFNGGFAAAKPKAQAIRKGLYKAKALSRRSPVLILWIEAWWVRKGDQLDLKIIGPDGETVVTHTSQLPKLQARRMAFAGRKKKGLFWPGGTYTGEAVLTRNVSGKVHQYQARYAVELKD